MPERPAFFVTAGHRGGGKTTTVHMISMAALGQQAAAAAWSPSSEERRKALFSYLDAGVPLICWDNIPRGVGVSCPSIEKALTSRTYTDRVLGKSATATVQSTSVHLFTGNNIGPSGDMTSRSLSVRLAVSRVDPENRSFRHSDALAWTSEHRPQLLKALYTILRGNPHLQEGSGSQETRFKCWWQLIGSAVESAAEQHAQHVDALVMTKNESCSPQQFRFVDLFMTGEGDDEKNMALAAVLQTIRDKWNGQCTAKQAAAYAGEADEGGIAFKALIEQATGEALKVVSAPALTWRLKSMADAPVRSGSDALVLRYHPNHQGAFVVVEKIG